jgi:GT2 family glycosyltransferase
MFIIVLNWNGPADTLDCLRSLDRLDYPSTRLVVVDYGSVEATRIEPRIRGRPCSAIATISDTPGGNNRGIRHALAEGADYIWLLNNDTVAARI